MKLIVTRPSADAAPLAQKLRAMGHEVIVMPLLEIVPRLNIAVPSLPWQAICFTSANAPRALPCRAQWRGIPVFTVGPQSQAEAERNGYMGAMAMGGNVAALAQALAPRVTPSGGPILYVTGAEISGDLKGVLERGGFTVHRIEAYDAVACATPNLAAAVAGADGVLLYSPRTASLWQQALDRSNVTLPPGFTHFCLSPNVAAALPQNTRHRIAANSGENALLDIIKC